MNELNARNITAKTSEIYNDKLTKRLIDQGLYEDKIKLLEEDSLSELTSYFSYVCDSGIHKPYIPANLIIRAESTSEALSFARWLIKAEEERKAKKISVTEIKENELTKIKFERLTHATEETILLIKDLREERNAPTDIRSKASAIGATGNRWDEYSSIIRSGRNNNARIIICASYDGIRKFIDERPDKAVRTALQTLFAYDIKLKCKTVSEITEMLLERLGIRFRFSSVFKKRLAAYNENNYPDSALKGAEYVEDIANKIIKEKYSRVPDIPILAADIIPALKLSKNDIPSREASLAAINSLTGLANVKKLLKELDGFCRLNPAQAKDMYLNFVFTGNPGTGKTTVAHMMADMLCSMGVIGKNKVIEITPSQLIGHYIGDSDLYVRDAFKRAKDGILFIDEAYSLNPKEAFNNLKAFKDDALALFLKEMEINRDSVIVIFAGYGEEMDQLLEANPGLKSRIYKTIEFEDYSEDELLEIFKSECNKGGYSYGDDTLKKAGEKLHILKYDESFGNARTAKTVFQEACLAYLEEDPSMSERSLKPEHIKIESKLPDYDSCRDELERLVGLNSAKKSIGEIAAVCRYNSCTGKAVVPTAVNMLFRGNPGTGKTTVAKLFGNMLFALGAVKAPRFVSINAYELNTSRVGGVSKNLKEYCRKAMGGVLFIDEAYAIGEFISTSASDAINVLLDMMENHREDLVIIFAGYPDKMKEFFDRNPGLRSRVPVTIDFEDYTLDELEEIFISLCKKNDFKVTVEAIDIVRETLSAAMGMEDFANARTVRNSFEKAYKNHAVRIVENDCNWEEDVLTVEDMNMDGVVESSRCVPLGFR